ncbi:DUF2179 domain-containing protein [Limibacter armeniacum]|uniref:DUF2179 domain-containing protein n=1 Tax=Limibacter armeniacum TaxID=466084 RepID=UPI002FE5DD09
MQSSFADFLGISPEIFGYVVLPLMIFMARISDVSINTLRIIFMLNDRRGLSTVLGFFEAFIWLVAIGQIFQNIDNILSYFAYAGGFATGIWVGMHIEGKLAIGNVILRVITQRDGDAVANRLRYEGYRMTEVDATGSQGNVKILFLVMKRRQIPDVTHLIQETNPKAFYTIESIKKVSEATALNRIVPGALLTGAE